jgi:hypothetical protein
MQMILNKLIRWRVSTIIIVISLAGLVLIYFLVVDKPINSKAENYVNDYINHSAEIDITDVEQIDDIEMKTIYTGLIKFQFQRSKLSGVSDYNFTFYEKNHGKYFTVFAIGATYANFKSYMVDFRRSATKKAKISEYQLKEKNYGTKENPVPVLYFEIPKYNGWKDYEDTKITEEQYRTAVYFYLTYKMPEKEFKERFKK